MINCIIVEDEELAQDVIQSHLENFRELELVGVFRNAQEADIALQTLEVDLMFLDIRLPAMSGMSLLKSLNNPPLVVLTTAYPEYALHSAATPQGGPPTRSRMAGCILSPFGNWPKTPIISSSSRAASFSR